MLVLVNNEKLVSKFSGNKSLEDEFLEKNPSYITTDFKFTEHISLYKYENETFSLIENWEEKKAEMEALNAPVEVVEEVVEEVPLTLAELKVNVITQITEASDIQYKNALATYPQIEQDTFDDRKNEAMAYLLDSTIATPLIDATLAEGFTEAIRIEEIYSVVAKVKYFAFLGGQVRDLRSAVNACKTIEELEALQNTL